MSTNNDNAAQWMKNLADDIAGEIEDIGSNHREDYLLKKIQEHAPAAADDSKELLDWLSNNPQSMSYLQDGLWYVPFLMDGSVVCLVARTLREAIRNAKAR